MERFTPDSQEIKETVGEKKINIIEGSSLSFDMKLDLALLSLDRKQVAILGDYKITETESEKEGVLKFLGFQPSREHWREEFEKVRENQRLIKEKAPDIYQGVMESDENFE